MNRSSPFVWVRLLIPAPLDVDPARAALTALAGLAGQPRIVLEATGANGVVSWRLGAERNHVVRILAALQAHLPGLRHEPIASTLDGLERADLAASVRFSGNRRLPLKVDASAVVVRGLLAALSRTRKREALYVQLILGPRSRPSRTPIDPKDQRQERTQQRRKSVEHGFACQVRIAASSADPARARSLINSAIGPIRGLEVPGVAVRVCGTSVLKFSAASSPWIWPTYLSVSDVVPLTTWPLGEMPLPGVPPQHPKLLPVSKEIPETGRILGDATSDLGRPIALHEDDSLRHLHIIGPTGVGKSTVIANLAVQDMEAGKGLFLVDPKGDLAEDILARVPAHRQADVVVLDPLDESPVGLNPLHGGTDADRSADALLGVFHELYGDSLGPRSTDILNSSLLTLARRGDASLAMIPTLLTNPGFRRSVIGRPVKEDPMGLGSFWSWFESVSEAERQNAIAPLMNKLRPILLRPGIRGIFGQRSPQFDVADIFTKRRILIVSLARGRMGPEAAQLLGAVVTAMVWDAAMVRSASAAKRHPVSLFIDEVQLYLRLPGDLNDALATARSMGVQLHLAHQALTQLPPAVREAILSNARSRVAFQLSARDAKDVAAMSRGQVEADDLLTLPAFQAYASLLVKGTPAPWVSLSTRPMPPVTSNPAVIRAMSRTTYGQPLTDIEADLISLSDTPRRGGGDRIGRTRRPPADGTEEVSP